MLARELTWDGQLRWLGPEKGVMHMAIGAVVNAAWDLRCRLDGQPLWRVLASLTPEEIVAQIDFTYIDDAITPHEALAILEAAAPGRAARVAALEADGLPAYTTSAGWIGYDDAKVERLVREAVADGFTMLKLKVGADVESDIRRMRVARDAVGPDVRTSPSTPTSDGASTRRSSGWASWPPFDPYWIEEPTSPDDVLGHRAIREAVQPIAVATGEHVQNRVIFKQMLQAEAIDVVQIDACRVGGVNENLAIMLLAAKFGVPVCPHAGGVGLCEMVQHLAMFDFVAVSGTYGEPVDRVRRPPARALHRSGRRHRWSLPGAAAGRAAGARMLDESIAEYRFPDGPAWTVPADVTNANRCPPSRVGSRRSRPAVDGRRRRWRPSRAASDSTSSSTRPAASGDRRERRACRRSPTSPRREELLDLAAGDAATGGRRRLGRRRRGRRRRATRSAAGDGRPGAWLVGIRSMVQYEPDPAWLQRPAVRRRACAKWPGAGSSTNCWCVPHQLDAAVACSARCPRRPVRARSSGQAGDRCQRSGSRGPASSPRWRGATNVVAKISGLVTEADWSQLDSCRSSAVRRSRDLAHSVPIDCSSAATGRCARSLLRTQQSSGWPRTSSASSPPHERAAIFGGNAAAIYQLDTSSQEAS